jgi:ankyrin repeat protein
LLNRIYRSPILIAAHHGYYKVLDTFKRSPKSDFSLVEKNTGKTVLHEVFLRDSAKHQDGRQPRDSSYAKCVKVLLGKGFKSHRKFEGQMRRVINYQEELDGNTALHLATMQADQDVIKTFLRRGANMGVKNHRYMMRVKLSNTVLE